MDYLPKKEDGKVSVSFRDDIPLELTAKRGHIEAASLLISHYRLNIDFQSWGGNTALHFASAWGEVPFMRFLLNMGATVDPPGLVTNTMFYLSLLFFATEGQASFYLGKSNAYCLAAYSDSKEAGTKKNISQARFLCNFEKTQGQNNSSRFFRQLKQNHSKTQVYANYKKKNNPSLSKKHKFCIKNAQSTTFSTNPS